MDVPLHGDVNDTVGGCVRLRRPEISPFRSEVVLAASRASDKAVWGVHGCALSWRYQWPYRWPRPTPAARDNAVFSRLHSCHMWVCSFSERTDLWCHLLVINLLVINDTGKNFSPVTLSPAINLLPVFMSPAYIFPGVVVTNGNCSPCLRDHWKFVTRINCRCRWRQWTVYRWCLWHLINVHLRISPQIFENIWDSPNRILYSGAGGTLIHEKWIRKSRQTPYLKFTNSNAVSRLCRCIQWRHFHCLNSFNSI